MPPSIREILQSIFKLIRINCSSIEQMFFQLSTVNLTPGLGVSHRMEKAKPLSGPSLHTDIQQSCRRTSITEEADIPISVLTIASADLTALQLENMLNFSLNLLTGNSPSFTITVILASLFLTFCI